MSEIVLDCTVRNIFDSASFIVILPNANLPPTSMMLDTMAILSEILLSSMMMIPAYPILAPPPSIILARSPIALFRFTNDMVGIYKFSCKCFSYVYSISKKSHKSSKVIMHHFFLNCRLPAHSFSISSSALDEKNEDSLTSIVHILWW